MCTCMSVSVYARVSAYVLALVTFSVQLNKQRELVHFVHKSEPRGNCTESSVQDNLHTRPVPVVQFMTCSAFCR